MNMNRLVNMAVRMLMRTLMKKGIDAGIGAVQKRTAQKGEEIAPDADLGKKARQTGRMTRL